MESKEIIKALECCTIDHCSICPCREEAHCVTTMPEYALDLINKQQAEIENLKDMVSQNEGVLPRYEQLIRVGAIKRFAEKLEHKLADNGDMTMAMWLSVVTDMHDLVKEMVGQNEDND